MRKSLTLAVLLLTAYGTWLFTSHSDPVRQFRSCDLTVYRAAGMCVRNAQDPYVEECLSRAAKAMDLTYLSGTLYRYPPPLAACLSVIPPPNSIAWFGVMASLFLLAMVFLAQLFPSRPLWVIPIATLFPPVLFDLFVGQLNLALLASLVLLMYALRWERSWVGVFFGFALAMKPLLWPVVMVLLGARQWRPLAAMALGFCMASAAGIILWPEGWMAYLAGPAFPFPTLRPEDAHTVNQSLQAGILRLTTETRWSSPLVPLPGLAAIAGHIIMWGTLCFSLFLGWRAPLQINIPLAGCLAVMASPLAWEPVFVLTLPAMYVAFERCPAGWARVGVIAATLLLIGQRALDFFANNPEAYPWLRTWGPTSLAMWGNLLLVGLLCFDALSLRLDESQAMSPSP